MRTYILILCCMFFAATVHAEQPCKPDSIPASTPDSQLVDNGDDTVTDFRTRLMWKLCAQFGLRAVRRFPRRRFLRLQPQQLPCSSVGARRAVINPATAFKEIMPTNTPIGDMIYSAPELPGVFLWA